MNPLEATRRKQAMRREMIEALRANPDIEVLIIGGGINGVGLLRELAVNGVDALLIDKSDFCAGASAASTRIIHGGLRYLENGEFRLVREALNERNRLLKNAPHYVRPLGTTIPIFRWSGGLLHAAKTFFRLSDRPGKRGALLIKIGLTMYDAFAGWGRSLPRHRFARHGAALQKRPPLNPAIVATATYYDARITYPERLCLELILDAGALHSSARALNYVTVDQAAGDTVTLRNELSGETIHVRPQIVVNASGAWIDFTNQALQRDTRFIGGTKGSHLVIDLPALYAATNGEMLYFENVEGRICIFYPFEGKVIAGSTDIPVSDPDSAVCDPDETDYLLDSIRQVFPTIQPTREHVVHTYSGVRPLPRSNALTPGQISRDHSVPVVPPGNGIDFPIYSLVGGKWTTFRAFAEQVADLLLPVLGRARRGHTRDMAIGGGRGYPNGSDSDRMRWLTDLNQRTGVPTERLHALFSRYGTRAAEIATYIAAGQDAPLTHHAGYSRREIEFLAGQERVARLDDVVLRRTLIGLLGEVTIPLLIELAGILAPILGWSAAQAEAEVDRTADLLRTRHGMRLFTFSETATPLRALDAAKETRSELNPKGTETPRKNQVNRQATGNAKTTKPGAKNSSKNSTRNSTKPGKKKRRK